MLERIGFGQPATACRGGLNDGGFFSRATVRQEEADEVVRTIAVEGYAVGGITVHVEGNIDVTFAAPNGRITAFRIPVGVEI